MDPVIQRLHAADRDRLLEVLELAAGRHATADALAAGRDAYDPALSLAIYDGGRLVGGGGFDLLELTVPGPNVVPAARSLLAGVLPTHRRRGLITEMTARQLADIRDSGISVVAATTSSPPVSARVGYGAATTTMDVTIDIDAIEVEPAQDGGCRMLSDGEMASALPRLFDAHRRVQPGQVSRADVFWSMWLRDRELFRLGTGPRFAVVHDGDSGEPDGYVTYRLEAGELRDQPVEAIVVEDLIATNERARIALWRFCLAFQQARVVRCHNVAPDEPLVWTLRDRRRWRSGRLRDFLWLRITRVEALLAAREYVPAGELTIDVADRLLADNAGRFRLSAQPEGTSVERTTAPADLALDVSVLSSVYLGATTFSSLARVGKIDERVPGALRRADQMFSVPSQPWTATDW